VSDHWQAYRQANEAYLDSSMVQRIQVIFKENFYLVVLLKSLSRKCKNIDLIGPRLNTTASSYVPSNASFRRRSWGCGSTWPSSPTAPLASTWSGKSTISFISFKIKRPRMKQLWKIYTYSVSKIYFSEFLLFMFHPVWIHKKGFFLKLLL